MKQNNASSTFSRLGDLYLGLKILRFPKALEVTGEKRVTSMRRQQYSNRQLTIPYVFGDRYTVIRYLRGFLCDIRIPRRPVQCFPSTVSVLWKGRHVLQSRRVWRSLIRQKIAVPGSAPITALRFFPAHFQNCQKLRNQKNSNHHRHLNSLSVTT